jgi:hypothetical protein
MPEIEKIMATNLKKLFGRDIYQKPRNYAVF